jgi:hypothetical protein
VRQYVGFTDVFQGSKTYQTPFLNYQ